MTIFAGRQLLLVPLWIIDLRSRLSTDKVKNPPTGGGVLRRNNSADSPHCAPLVISSYLSTSSRSKRSSIHRDQSTLARISAILPTVSHVSTRGIQIPWQYPALRAG